MKCLTPNARGGRCQNPCWGRHRMCKGHLREAARDLVEDEYGEGAKVIVVIPGGKDADDLEYGVEYE